MNDEVFEEFQKGVILNVGNSKIHFHLGKRRIHRHGAYYRAEFFVKIASHLSPPGVVTGAVGLGDAERLSQWLKDAGNAMNEDRKAREKREKYRR